MRTGRNLTVKNMYYIYITFFLYHNVCVKDSTWELTLDTFLLKYTGVIIRYIFNQINTNKTSPSPRA